MKKTISVFLATYLALSCSVSAKTYYKGIFKYCDNNGSFAVYYPHLDNEIMLDKILNYGGYNKIIIPASIDGFRIKFASSDVNHSKIGEIEVEKGIENIYSAFYLCGAKSIVLPEGIFFEEPLLEEPDGIGCQRYDLYGANGPLIDNCTLLERLELYGDYDELPVFIENCPNLKTIIFHGDIKNITENFKFNFYESTILTQGQYHPRSYTTPYDITIYAKTGSNLEKFASDNGFKFADITAAPPSPFEGVSPMISHFTYISGYPDGTFRPDKNITRAEAAAMVSKCIISNQEYFSSYIDHYNTFYPSNPESFFSDCTPEDWYFCFAEHISNIGYTYRYCNNITEPKEFRPNDNITRSEYLEFLQILNMNILDDSFDEDDTTAPIPINLSPLEYAQRYDFLTSDEIANFDATAPITRAEAVVLLNKVINRNPDKNYISKNIATLNKFSDISDTAWYFSDVLSAANTIQCVNCPHID